MAGIDSLVNSRADMFAANPQGLEQRYAMNQDLLDLLALQKLKKDKEAAQRSLQMQMQAPQGTVKDQLAGQVMDMTKQEVAASLAPGLQQMGQRMAAEQAQRAMSGGLPTQPAPNMVGMARGGIVGYQEGGGPVEEDEERRLSGYAIRQAEKAAMRERAGPEMQEFMQGVEENIAGGRDWVAENPLEALSYAAMVASGAGVAPAVGRAGLAALPKVGPRLMNAVRNLYSRSNPAFTSRVTKKGTRLYPEGVPERLFSPGRTAATGAGLGALDYALGALGGEDGGAQADQYQGTDADIAAMLGEDVAPTRPAEAQAAPIRSGIAALPPTDRRSAEEAAMGAYDARANQYQGTEKDIAAMLGEDVAPMQRAAPTAPIDPRMSRYEDQLARLEAEEKDKLGALIDFLLAAGASGGTNLGATLMGGGSGLQAREQRIKDEMARTIQNIETLQFQRDEMQARREEAAADRASREGTSAAEIAARRDMTAAEIESRERMFNSELDQKTRADAARLQVDALKLEKDLLGDDRRALEKAAELLSEYVGNAMLSPEERAPYQTALDDVLRKLGVGVTTGAADEDPDVAALVAQYGTPVAR